MLFRAVMFFAATAVYDITLEIKNKPAATESFDFEHVSPRVNIAVRDDRNI